MNMQWRRVSRRRGMMIAGVAAALLAAGGTASAATSGHATTAKHHGVGIEEVPGVTLLPAKDLPMGKAKVSSDPIKVLGGTGKTVLPPNSGGVSLKEVPGAWLPYTGAGRRARSSCCRTPPWSSVKGARRGCPRTR
ncbi:hypothetical protein ACQ86D_36355 [Streptomyces galilaeus]